jgi:hypothetical protein
MDQAILDEALMPELSLESFGLLGQTVAIKPLKVKYQIEFSRVLHPLVSDAAFDLDAGNWVSALSDTLRHAEVLPRLVRILANNDGHTFSDDDVLESDMQLDEMVCVLLAFAAKNKAIGEPVIRFFLNAWKAAKSDLGKLAEQIQDKLSAGLIPTN